MRDEPAGEQLPDEAHRFLQHLDANAHRGPGIAQDVLVQVLTAAHAQEEAARHHVGHRRRRVGDEGGMDPERRAGHPRSDPQALRLPGDPAEDGPHEGTLPLRVGPWMVVIRDHGETETARLGGHRPADQIAGSMLLT
jgi:hypothetical protein